MKYSRKEIAEFFSNGKFDLTMEYLSDNIFWEVVGENTFSGRKSVEENCKQTAEYFKSVETDFKTEDVIDAEKKVIVTGTAEFKKDGKLLNFISACDVYHFDQDNQVERIVSYCIPAEKK